MKEKTKEKIKELIKSRYAKDSSRNTILKADIIDLLVYILFLEKIQITWHQLEETLERVVRSNWTKKKNIYEIFIGCFAPGAGPLGGTASSWENYFLWRPARLTLSMGQGSIRSMDGPIFKSHDWPKFKKIIETQSILPFHAKDLPRLFEIADDLLNTIKDQKIRGEKI